MADKFEYLCLKSKLLPKIKTRNGNLIKKKKNWNRYLSDLSILQLSEHYIGNMMEIFVF